MTKYSSLSEITVAGKKVVRRESPAHDRLGGTFGPVLARILAARGVQSEHEIDYQLKNLIPPDRMLGLEDAVERLLAALHLQEHVLVVGDFDADGATSSAIAVRGLRAMGFQSVDFLVPNRFEFGYGLTPEIVDVGLQQSPDLIVTVDNGIAANAGVAHANEQGVDVIVTDHHLPGEQLPEAVAIVNPNQPGCPFPSKSIAGVGVMFYLLLALRKSLLEANWFKEQAIPMPNLAQLLDLVALGTVADVVTLDFNNRILVEQGLRRIRAGKACPGVLALLECAGRDYRRLSASDLGFVLGPRLNAAGRMHDMSIGIRCLLSEDSLSAGELARELDQLNRERRGVEAGMKQEAQQMLAELRAQETEPACSVCLFEPGWHQGVIGILASRVKDQYHRPTIAFARSDDGFLKGSARSIRGLNIRDLIDEVSKLQPGLILQFGGHAMAAGLNLPEENFPRFVELFEQVVARHASKEILQATLFSDGELGPQDFSAELARTLRFAGPWGQGYPEPLFDGQFRLLKQRIVGEKHLKLVVAPIADARQLLDAIVFNVDTACWPDESVEQVSLLYQLDLNFYRGEEQVQLLVNSISVA